MKYLTKSYVEAFNLELVPFRMPRNQGHISVGLHGTLRPPDSAGWPEGVVLDGVSYRREPDGLAYTRLPQR